MLEALQARLGAYARGKAGEAGSAEATARLRLEVGRRLRRLRGHELLQAGEATRTAARSAARSAALHLRFSSVC